MDLLKGDGFTTAKLAPVPMVQNHKLSIQQGTSHKDPKSYRRLEGRLFGLTMTRPDISNAIQHLSKLVSDLKEQHM